jgi:hypothetical protein
MSEMIERVARAIWAAQEQEFAVEKRQKWEQGAAKTKEVCLRSARAAISAMGTPTPAMIEAGEAIDPGYEDGNARAEWHWEAMIKEALK